MQKLLSILVIGSLLYVPVALARPVAQSIELPTSTSLAVFTETKLALENLETKVKDNTDRSIDWAQAASATRVMFAYMSEIGLTAKIQAYILAHPNEFIDPAPAQLAVSHTTLADRERFVSDVRTKGLATFHAAVVAWLEFNAQQASERQNNPLLHQARVYCPAFAAGSVGLYFSIVGLVVAGPVGVAFGVAGVALGGVAFVCG